jgi:hypothetical protein
MPTLLERLVVEEISLVDRPANKGARVVLAKREVGAKERAALAGSGNALPGGSFPIKNVADLKNAIQSIGRAKDKAAAKALIIRRAKELGATELLPKTWSVKKEDEAETYNEIRTEQTIRAAIWTGMDALRESVMSILRDDTVTDPAAMVAQSVNQFRDDIVGQIGKSEGDDEATVKKVHDLVDEIWAVVQPTTGMEKTMPKTVAELEADLAKSNAERDEAIALSKMSDAEKAYCAGMDAEKKKSFMAMKPEERKRMMSAKKTEKSEDDETISLGGQMISKSGVGAEVFAALKSNADENARLAGIVAKGIEDREVEEITKRLNAAGPVPKAEETAKAIRKMSISDPEGAKVLENSIIAAAEQAKKADAVLTRSGGSSQPRSVAGDAYSQLAAKAEELRKGDPKLTFEGAFTKVYSDAQNAELVQLYKKQTATHAQ